MKERSLHLATDSPWVSSHSTTFRYDFLVFLLPFKSVPFPPAPGRGPKSDLCLLSSGHLCSTVHWLPCHHRLRPPHFLQIIKTQVHSIIQGLFMSLSRSCQPWLHITATRDAFRIPRLISPRPMKSASLSGPKTLILFKNSTARAQVRLGTAVTCRSFSVCCSPHLNTQPTAAQAAASASTSPQPACLSLAEQLRCWYTALSSNLHHSTMTQLGSLIAPIL